MEICYYQTTAGRRPFTHWLDRQEREVQSRVLERLAKITAGNWGDVRSVGDGVAEFRIDWGPGYRIYFARLGELIVLLLCAGDKRLQRKDIERAKAYFKDYKARAS